MKNTLIITIVFIVCFSSAAYFEKLFLIPCVLFSIQLCLLFLLQHYQPIKDFHKRLDVVEKALKKALLAQGMKR